MSYLCYIYIIIYIGKTKASRGEGQRLDGLPSFPPRPLPRPILQVVRVGQSKRANEKEREGTMAKDAAAIFARSSPLLLRLMSSPSTPSPAAHPIARLCQRSGRGTGGHLVRFWAMSSPHLANSSPATSSQQTAGQRLDGLTSCPPRPLPRPSLLSVALTVHALSRSSLPSSSAVPVILRPDLVRSLSSVRPSVFLFLVPLSLLPAD